MPTATPTHHHGHHRRNQVQLCSVRSRISSSLQAVDPCRLTPLRQSLTLILPGVARLCRDGNYSQTKRIPPLSCKKLATQNAMTLPGDILRGSATIKYSLSVQAT